MSIPPNTNQVPQMSSKEVVSKSEKYFILHLSPPLNPIFQSQFWGSSENCYLTVRKKKKKSAQYVLNE